MIKELALSIWEPLRIRKLLVVAGLCSLNACASWYDAKVSTPASYHQPAQIDESYNISGRFSIKTAAKDYYGNFNWQHESGNDNLEFMSPLGTTVAEIKVESDLATLTTTDNSYTGTDLEQIMTERLGFTLPLAYLHYWIQGVPLPQFPVQNRLNSGFSQLRWQIEYLSWQDAEHPQILVVSKDQLYIKLLMNWPSSN